MNEKLIHYSNNNSSNSSSSSNNSNNNLTISTNLIDLNNINSNINNIVLIENSNAYNSSSLTSNNSFKLNNFTSLAKNFEIDQDFEIKNEIELRNLCSEDIPELKILCAEWFPVDYPDSWYIDITSTKRFYSLAAIYKKRIVGMIVAEIKTKKSTDKEDWHILSNKHSSDTQITYILSLGVYKELRRHGIASLLLDTLLTFLKSETDCKAIYLHVLYSNFTAINFYEKRNFEKRIYLPKYYTINGQLQDGYCYVLYINNGQPPWTITDCMKDAWNLTKAYNPCKLSYKLVLFINSWIRSNIYNAINRKDFYRIS